MKLWSLVLVLFLIFLSSPVIAQQTNLCGNKDATVFFGNGIRTTFDGAIDGLEELKSALRSELTEEEFDHIGFHLAYNPTGGAILDIFESARQDLATDASEFWRIWFNLLPMPDSLRNRIIDRLSSGLAELVNTDGLANHVAVYKRNILEGKKVLLVAHSQGTFYANQAYSSLSSTEQQSFGITSAALMDSYVAGGNPYVTLSTDVVVDAVRAVKYLAGLPGPLPSNVTNVALSNDMLHHSFEDEYMMGGSNSRASITSYALNTLSAIVQPNAVAHDGIITVTLTWGIQPDVDLHVFEPDGTHVYYANLQGTSGYLDHDDVTSWGPEHYYVSCDGLQSGTYKVGVNYYRGSAPEVAHINIRAGLIERNYDRFLPSALGSSGNWSPVGVADIIVTGDVENGYQFDVQ